MNEKNIRFIVSTFIVGILIGTLSTVVIAATATSNYGYYGPINGYSYKNQAKVGNDSGLYGRTTVMNDSAGTVPTGYMGTQARLYKSDALCEADIMYYNTSETSGGITVLTDTDCGEGTYYSKGVTAAYNGNGYDLYNTFQTPNIIH